jgi:hypothetical protein
MPFPFSHAVSLFSQTCSIALFLATYIHTACIINSASSSPGLGAERHWSVLHGTFMLQFCFYNKNPSTVPNFASVGDFCNLID